MLQAADLHVSDDKFSMVLQALARNRGVSLACLSPSNFAHNDARYSDCNIEKPISFDYMVMKRRREYFAGRWLARNLCGKTNKCLGY